LYKIYRSLRSVFLIFLVFCVLLLCVFTLWVPCCEFRIQAMFGSSLPPVVCKRAHVLLTLFAFASGYWCPTHIVLGFFPLAFSLSCVTCTESERYLQTSDFRLRTSHFEVQTSDFVIVISGFSPSLVLAFSHQTEDTSCFP
jgi:hypothetical protein